MKFVTLIESIFYVVGALLLMHGIRSFVRSRVKPISANDRSIFLKAFAVHALKYTTVIAVVVGSLLGGYVLLRGGELTNKGCVFAALIIVVPIVAGVCEDLEGYAHCGSRIVLCGARLDRCS